MWAVTTVGNSSDTWGSALTTAWLKDPDFAFGIGCNISSETIEVDCVSTTIYYTESSGTSGVISSRATECRAIRNSTRRPASRR